VAWARGLLRGMSTAEQLWPAMPVAKPGQATAQKPALTLTLVGGAASVPLSLDAELVARALRGGAVGAQAEEALYRRYQGAVSRLASSFSELDADEADDVVQEAFVRAFRALPSLKDLDRFAPWLFTIARNRARSYLSSRATHTKAAEEASREATLAGDTAPAPSQQMEREAELRAVREVIEALRDGPEKETVRLFYLEGTLSAREIAQRMGVGKSAVTMRLERFRAKVKKQLISRCAG
jgi:RNA polymerase sigma-70 factor (ECF subfamily)